MLFITTQQVDTRSGTRAAWPACMLRVPHVLTPNSCCSCKGIPVLTAAPFCANKCSVSATHPWLGNLCAGQCLADLRLLGAACKLVWLGPEISRAACGYIFLLSLRPGRTLGSRPDVPLGVQTADRLQRTQTLAGLDTPPASTACAGTMPPALPNNTPSASPAQYHTHMLRRLAVRAHMAIVDDSVSALAHPQHIHSESDAPTAIISNDQ